MISNTVELTANGLRIGSLILREAYGTPEDVAIYRASGGAAGEGGDFPAAEIERVLLKFYEDHF